MHLTCLTFHTLVSILSFSPCLLASPRAEGPWRPLPSIAPVERDFSHSDVMQAGNDDSRADKAHQHTIPPSQTSSLAPTQAPLSSGSNHNGVDVNIKIGGKDGPIPSGMPLPTGDAHKRSSPSYFDHFYYPTFPNDPPAGQTFSPLFANVPQRTRKSSAVDKRNVSDPEYWECQNYSSGCSICFYRNEPEVPVDCCEYPEGVSCHFSAVNDISRLRSRSNPKGKNTSSFFGFGWPVPPEHPNADKRDSEAQNRFCPRTFPECQGSSWLIPPKSSRLDKRDDGPLYVVYYNEALGGKSSCRNVGILVVVLSGLTTLML